MEADFDKTENEIEKVVAESTRIMIKKNRERGDCWRATGLRGQFIDIHTCYNRLRTSVWTKGLPPDKRAEWAADVLDSLRDMRNYTVLAEMCLAEDNYDGEDYWNDSISQIIGEKQIP